MPTKVLLAAAVCAAGFALGPAMATAPPPVTPDSIAAHAGTVPTAAPVNLAPNSQWEIWSGVGSGAALTPAGTGYESPIVAAGNSVARTALFYGYIDGRDLTVCASATSCPGAPVSGTIRDGQAVALAIPYTVTTPPNAPAGLKQLASGTRITGRSGSSWTVNNSQTVGGPSNAQRMWATVNAGYATFATNTIGDLSVGDLVRVSGAGVDGVLTAAPMRVTALAASPCCSITVRVPWGQTPTRSAGGETLTPIQVGAQWYAAHATGSGPDGWTRYPITASAGPILWRDLLQGRYAVNRPSEVTPYAAMGVRLQQAGDSWVGVEFPGNGNSPVGLHQFQGKTVVFGAYVMQKAQGGSGTWAVNWNIGGGFKGSCTSAAPHPGVWTWMECSETVPADATYMNAGIQFQGAVGDVYYVADPVLAIGSHIGGVKNYQKPRNEILVPLVHIAALTWGAVGAGTTITFPTYQQPANGPSCFCFLWDPYADTGGQIAPTVLKALGQMEGYNDGAIYNNSGYQHVFAVWDSGVAPEKSGSFLHSTAAGVKTFEYMDFPFYQSSSPALQGTLFVKSNISADTWKNAAIEMDWFILQ